MKTAVLIDGANLNAAANRLLMRLDFNQVRNWLDARYDTPLIQYYTALYANKENNGHVAIQGLVDWLNYNGYRVISKPARKMGDKIKGNMDIEIAVDAIELIAHGVERVVLFSGDGDFCPLVTYLQRRGVWVIVVSTHVKDKTIVADELRKQCDQFIELDDLRDVFEKQEEKIAD